MKKLMRLAAVFVAIMTIFTCSAVVFAENESESEISAQASETQSEEPTEPDQSSEETEQSEESQESEKSEQSQEPESSVQEEESSKQEEVSEQSEDESSTTPGLLSEEESYYEESEPEEISDYESEVSQEQSWQYSEPEFNEQEPSTITKKLYDIADPFMLIEKMDAVLPFDRKGFVAPKKNDQNSVTEVADPELSEQSGVIEFSLLESPPLPTGTAALEELNDKDNEAVLLGLIFWSVIGIIVTAVLIIIVNSKGNDTEFVFSRKRYHKREKRKAVK